MRRASDLECLDAVVAYYRRFGYGMTMLCGGSDARRGIALIDAALVRGLREWDGPRDGGNGQLIAALGVVAEALLPHVGRKARTEIDR